MMKEKGKDILVIALAALTVLLCLIVLFKEFPAHRELEALVTATPVPTEAPAPTAEPAPTEAPEATPEPTPTPNINEEAARAALAGMSREEKVWQLILATPESLTDVDAVTITGDLMRWSLDSRPLGGLIYASRNTENTAQVTEMLADVKALAETPMFIAYDSDAGTSAVKLDGNMAELGFNLVIDKPDEAGVLHALPYTEGADLSGAGLVLVSAALMDPPQAVTEEEPEEAEDEDGEDEAPLGTPYCLSETYVAAVREAAGNDALLLTAPLYAAEGWSSGDLARAALLAGCDMIVAPTDADAAVEAILDAINSGALSESRLNESVRRVLLAKFDASLMTAAGQPAEEAVPVAETEAAPEVQDSRE